MEMITTYRTRATEWYGGLERRNKIILIVGILTLIIAIAITTMMFTRTTYIALVRGETETKTAEITNKLDELGIKWQSENNATSILVEESQIDKARMQLAISGITTDQGWTFADVMDKISFTNTTEVNNKMFLYQTKSEIENTLKALDDIEDAVVLINVKASSSFLNLEEDVSSASVQLKISEGKTLAPESINGIMSFVQMAVKGLTPETIAIIDQNGVKLNMAGGSEQFQGAESRDEFKIGIQKRIDQSIINLLGTIYGPNNVTVVTNVVLDFDSKQQESVEYALPIEGEVDGLIRSSNVLKESVANGTHGGAAGTDSNTTDVTQYPTLEGAESDYTKTQEIYNRELNEIHQTIVKAPGEITDMSIAIIINSDILEENILPEANKQALIDMIIKASGANDDKKISVSAWPFHHEEEVPLEEVPPAGLLGIPTFVWAIIAAVALVIIVLAVVLLRRRRTTAIQQEVQEIIDEQEELEEINTEFQDRSSPKFQIEKFIDTRPEAVANLLRSWMHDD